MSVGVNRDHLATDGGLRTEVGPRAHHAPPWFQKIADRLLAPHTDVALAVSASTAEFTIRARLIYERR